MSIDTSGYTAEQLAEIEKRHALVEQQRAETARLAELLAQRQAAMDEAVKALEEAKKTDEQRQAEQQARLEVEKLQEQASYAARKQAFEEKTYKAAREYYLQKSREVGAVDISSNSLFNWLWERVEKAEIRIAELEAEAAKDVPIEKIKKLVDWFNWPHHLVQQRASLLKDVMGDMKVEVFGVPEVCDRNEDVRKAIYAPGSPAPGVGARRGEGKVKNALAEVEARIELFEKWKNPSSKTTN